MMARILEGQRIIQDHDLAAQPLQASLTVLALLLDAPVAKLAAYAEEKTPGGYEDGWPPGAAWGADLKVLYAAVRWLKPKRVLELGTWMGCSASTIAAAIARNGAGGLVCVDPWEKMAGLYVKPEERECPIVFERTTAESFLDATAVDFDLVFEDGPHNAPYWATVLPQLAMLGKRHPFWLFVHDAGYPLSRNVGDRSLANIRDEALAAWRDAFGTDPTIILTEPSPAGLAVGRIA